MSLTIKKMLQYKNQSLIMVHGNVSYVSGIQFLRFLKGRINNMVTISALKTFCAGGIINFNKSLFSLDFSTTHLVNVKLNRQTE